MDKDSAETERINMNLEPPGEEEAAEVEEESKLRAIGPPVAHILLDEYSQEDSHVTALSDQAHASELSSKKFVIVEDTSQSQTRAFFGQIIKGPVHIPEWGAPKDGINVFPVVMGDKVEYVPSFQGYIEVKILGEVKDGNHLENTFDRPYPKSRVRYPDKDYLQKLLELPQSGGILGVLANYKDEDIIMDMTDEIVRKQLGIFGATGSGKTNSVVVLAELLVQRDWCVIIFDHKGEYTNLNEPSEETALFQGRWEKLGIKPKGIDSKNFRRYIPVTDKRAVPNGIKFSVRSSDIPFEILKSMMNLTEAQTEHLDEVYYILRKDGREAVGINQLIDNLDKSQRGGDTTKRIIRSKLEGLERRGFFDSGAAVSTLQPPIFDTEPQLEVIYLTAPELIKSSTVNVIDFGNTASQDIINIVGLNVLTLLEEAKGTIIDSSYKTKVAIFLEEAHTFFSAEYAANPQFAHSLTGTIKRIYKIGRTFYLNPVVISQQPGDVGAGVLSQCNTKIIHQLTDEDDIRKVGKGAAREYTNIIPDLKTGAALITSPDLLLPQLVQVRPAMANKIDPYKTS
ncbi:MAG: ATP-binding protein [Dehalococcoidia bacterium]